MSISNILGSYYQIKNFNAKVFAQASLQKVCQDQITSQMNDLLKSLPVGKPSNSGIVIDIRV